VLATPAIEASSSEMAMQVVEEEKKKVPIQQPLLREVESLPPFAVIDNHFGDVGNMLDTVDFLNFLMVLKGKRKDVLLERTTQLRLPITRHEWDASRKLHFFKRDCPVDVLRRSRNLRSLEFSAGISDARAAKAESLAIVENLFVNFMTACEQGAMVHLNELKFSAKRAHSPPFHQLMGILTGGQLRSLTSIKIYFEFRDAPASELRTLMTSMAVGCPLLQEFELGIDYKTLEVNKLREMQNTLFENTWPSLRIVPQEFLEAPIGVDFVALRKQMTEAFTPGHLRFPAFTELIICESKTLSAARSAFAYFPDSMPQFTKLELIGRALRNPLLNS